jgi:hypothetical protein
VSRAAPEATLSVDRTADEWVVMELPLELDLGDLRLRTLPSGDAALLVEATQAEPGRALWGPHPAGPYSLEDARSALGAWDPHRHGEVSFGVLQGERLVGALGLMPDGPRSAELSLGPPLR